MADTNSTNRETCPWGQVSSGRIIIQKCTIPGCTGVHQRDYRPHGTRAPNIDAVRYADKGC